VLRTAYGFGSDSVLDENLRKELIYASIREAIPDLNEPGPLYERLRDEISYVKSERMKPDERRSRFCDQNSWERIYAGYERRLEYTGKIDYEDMAVMTYRLLSEREDIRRLCAERFRWILIDEFQDIDRTQYEIINMLAGSSGNITAVGDDDQSIYGFRGARPE